MMSTRNSILVVEDESEIRQLISLHLSREGYEVVEATDGERATRLLSERTFGLVILDWMLPSYSGLEITRWIRGRGLRTPILFVTAKTAPEDIVAGLEAGADDYLTKPFDTMVLMARTRSLLRREEWIHKKTLDTEPAEKNFLRVGELTMNLASYEVFLGTERLDLTRSEYRLLQAMMENQGRVLSRDRLIEQVQGEGVNVVGRTVDTHVFGLRKKLGSQADMIETIRGVGYRVRILGQE